MKQELLMMDPGVLRPNPFNPNKMATENFEKLKNSLRQLGFSAAVVVRELESGDLEILSGYHRTQAAVEMGIAEIPVLNLGPVSEDVARKICLAQNNRYGNDDVISLAKILEEIGDAESLPEILPISSADIEAVLNTVDIDLDTFDLDLGDEDEEPETPGELPDRPVKTHDVLKFRVSLVDAENIRQIIERTIRRESLADGDEMSNAGSALALLLLGEEKDD